MKKHVLILGAGFGGLELATVLSERHGGAVSVTLVDRNDSFHFGFSKLEVMMGRQTQDDVRLHYADFVKDGVEFRQETVTAIDPATRRVTTDAHAYDPDFLVVALGADYDMDATPGLSEGGFEFYTLSGAERTCEALHAFEGGRLLVSVLGQPFKCPPAPFEGAFLVHEHFVKRGIRDAVEMTMSFPMQRPVPVAPSVSQLFRDGLAERGIDERPQQLVTAIDPAKREARLADGESIQYEMFIGIPVHRAPDPLPASDLAPGGWIPVDQTNLRTQYPGIYAIGDVSTGPQVVPKAGVFAESAARVVAEDIAATVTGSEPPAPFSAAAVCYAEFGDGLVSKIDVNFLGGDGPAAEAFLPSSDFAREKAEFSASRRARWFDR